MMRVSLVGASGPLGELLHDHLVLAGHKVIRYSRGADDVSRRLDVLQENAFGIVQPTDRIIYLAWDTRDRSVQTQRAHADAAIKWAGYASERATPFFFASTTLASERASSFYGSEKYRAERGVEAAGGSVGRIGLVCDDSYPFLATRIRNSFGGAVISAIVGQALVFPVSGRQVGKTLLNFVDSPTACSRLWIASDSPVELRRIRSQSQVGRYFGLRESALRVLLARVGVRGSRIGVFDRLTGLLGGPNRMPSEFGITEEVSNGDWDECLFND
jgi:hypothetical protein